MFFDTVDSLVSKFTTLVTKLEDKAVQHTKASWEHSQLAEKYQEVSAWHQKESDRASAIAAKIRKLVSGD